MHLAANLRSAPIDETADQPGERLMLGARLASAEKVSELDFGSPFRRKTRWLCVRRKHVHRHRDRATIGRRSRCVKSRAGDRTSRPPRKTINRDPDSFRKASNPCRLPALRIRFPRRPPNPEAFRAKTHQLASLNQGDLVGWRPMVQGAGRFRPQGQRSAQGIGSARKRRPMIPRPL
jgi:hypothetical protein